MKISSSVIVFSGKIAKVGNIVTTQSGRQVVSVTIPARIGRFDTVEMVPFEVSFWGTDAEKIRSYPLGTSVTVTGVPYIKPFIKQDGKADVSIVVSATLWNTTEPAPTPVVSKPYSPPSALPDVLNEQMSGGKYKGKTYFEILSTDREYINALIVNEKTSEKWKVWLVEVSNAFDDYMSTDHVYEH